MGAHSRPAAAAYTTYFVWKLALEATKLRLQVQRETLPHPVLALPQPRQQVPERVPADRARSRTHRRHLPGLELLQGLRNRGAQIALKTLENDFQRITNFSPNNGEQAHQEGIHHQARLLARIALKCGM
jgi:hypothetical protein